MGITAAAAGTFDCSGAAAAVISDRETGLRTLRRVIVDIVLRSSGARVREGIWIMRYSSCKLILKVHADGRKYIFKEEFLYDNINTRITPFRLRDLV